MNILMGLKNHTYNWTGVYHNIVNDDGFRMSEPKVTTGHFYSLLFVMRTFSSSPMTLSSQTGR